MDWSPVGPRALWAMGLLSGPPSVIGMAEAHSLVCRDEGTKEFPHRLYELIYPGGDVYVGITGRRLAVRVAGHFYGPSNDAMRRKAAAGELPIVARTIQVFRTRAQAAGAERREVRRRLDAGQRLLNAHDFGHDADTSRRKNRTIAAAEWPQLPLHFDEPIPAVALPSGPSEDELAALARAARPWVQARLAEAAENMKKAADMPHWERAAHKRRAAAEIDALHALEALIGAADGSDSP